MIPKTIVGLVILVVCSTLNVTTALAAEVSQGKCIRYDQAAHLIILEEYDLQFSHDHPYGKPTGDQVVFNVKTARIGITPQSGDILRLSWVAENKEKKALKVMNVSKQDLKR